MRQWATHTLLHLFFLLFSSFPYCLMMWHATHMPCHLFLFSSLLFDNAVCNPHAVLSICSYFPCCLTTWCATHIATSSISFFFSVVWQCSVQPTCCVVYLFLFSLLFDNMVCNPHATSSISSYFIFPVVWQCGIQPTCCVVYFFFIFFSFPCCLTKIFS